MANDRKKSVVFRTDASDEIGLGHVMRCLALGQALKSAGYRVVFATVTINRTIINKLKKSGMIVEPLPLPWKSIERDMIRDIEATTAVLEYYGARWLVMDNYYFTAEYQKAFRNRKYLMMSVDDIASTEFCSHIVLNHGVQASRLRYRVSPGTVLLLGPEYALIRNDLLMESRTSDSHEEIKNLLVYLGGGKNPELINVLKMAEYLKNDLNIRVISGGDRGWTREIESHTRKLNKKITVLGYVDSMKQQYQWADIAICAAGSSLLEMCYYGLTGIAGVLSPDQELVAEEFDRRGIFRNIGWFKECSPRKLARELNAFLDTPGWIAKKKRQARELVDGRGPQRVIEAMRKVEKCQG